MTERGMLQQVILVKLREHADFLKHNVATWQLLARAADEIERLQKRNSELEQMLAQAGDSIELQEAEQKGFERGCADR